MIAIVEQKREKISRRIRPNVNWFSEKEKEKIKPGYKKKINWAIEDSNKKKRKIERRQKDRSARKAKKNSSN